MNLGIKLAASSMLLLGIATVGPGFCVSDFNRHSLGLTTGDNASMVQRSVIKVHTDHGVITLPGRAETWDQADSAVFLADSIADVQMVNNEVPWRINYE